MKMRQQKMLQQAETIALRLLCTGVSASRTRFIRGAKGEAAINDLIGATTLGGWLGELAGRSILPAAKDQLAAAGKLIRDA
jgi:hypothetical protein